MGKDHPLLMVALNRMAVLRSEIDGPQAAEPLRRRLLQLATDRLGRDHPDTIDAQANLECYSSRKSDTKTRSRC